MPLRRCLRVCLTSEPFEDSQTTAPTRCRQHTPGENEGQHKRPPRFTVEQLKQSDGECGRADEPDIQPQTARDERAFDVVLQLGRWMEAQIGTAAQGIVAAEEYCV